MSTKMSTFFLTTQRFHQESHLPLYFYGRIMYLLFNRAKSIIRMNSCHSSAVRGGLGIPQPRRQASQARHVAAGSCLRAVPVRHRGRSSAGATGRPEGPRLDDFFQKSQFYDHIIIIRNAANVLSVGGIVFLLIQ